MYLFNISIFLSTLNPIFLWIPIESIIYSYQHEYYDVSIISTKKGKTNTFISFMLYVINEALEILLSCTNNHIKHTNERVSLLLGVIDTIPQSAEQLMRKLNLKSRLGFRNNYLNPALELGLIKMTEPDKPTSKNQRYYRS